MKKDQIKFTKRKLGLWVAMLVSAGVLMNTGRVQASSAPNYDYNVVTDAEEKVNPKDKISDSKGIQSVLNKAIGSKKEITIYFPAGTYNIDKTLRVYSNTHLILDKNATLYRMDSWINREVLFNVDQNSKRDVVGKYNMSKNITIEGGTIDGGNTAKAAKGTDVVRFDHAENITIKDCTIKNTYDCHILELVGVKNGEVSGCTFTGFRYKKGKENDYKYAREAIQIETAWKTGNEPWARGSVIDGTSCKNVVITDNKFNDIPCGVGQHRHTKDGKYRNEDITITNNTITCSSKNKAAKIAITCIGINNLTVKNNIVKGPYQFAMHVMVADGVVIEGNQAEGMKQNGIMVDSGKNVVISNNTLKNIAKHGISVGGGTVKKVSGNKITNVKWNGISVDDGKVTSITGNTINKAKKHGISIIDIHGKADCALKNITKNKISNTGENGICINKAKVTNVSGNTLKTINKSGIVLIAGSIGSGKSRTKGIQENKITGCKQHGVVAMSGTISSIGKNKISNMGVNGISLSGDARVYYIVKNNLKKCKRQGIFNGSSYTQTKIQGNTGQK